jgi:DNA-binding NtrC family response regulator
MDIQSIKQRFSIIGNAPALNYAISIAERVAPTNLSVLILGESGVGKEVFSRIIHALSPRKHNKFIAINCGAIPEGTIDSELFGHEKGSFTGAQGKREGYFETVNGGTIFLDEIGELPIGTQARLLRILENGEFIKVGSSEVQKTDVRIVAATNKNLLNKIESGKFREDLYYRLSTVPIEIPPLRDRGMDVELLFKKFSADFSEKNRIPLVQLTKDALDLLYTYDWPGNVRQLKNAAEQIAILSNNNEVSAADILKIIPSMQRRNLPKLVDQSNTSSSEYSMSEREILYKIMFDLKKDMNDLKQFVLQMAKTGNYNTDQLKNITNNADDYHLLSFEKPETTNLFKPNSYHNEEEGPIIINKNAAIEHTEMIEETTSLADMEKKMIVTALEKFKGKRKKAAQELQISERTLYRKIKEYHIAI